MFFQCLKKEHAPRLVRRRRVQWVPSIGKLAEQAGRLRYISAGESFAVLIILLCKIIFPLRFKALLFGVQKALS